MRIAFVLPGHDDRPYGGYRVVYEHVRGLVEGGHEVRVLYPAARRLREPLRRAGGTALGLVWPLLPPGRRAPTVSWFPLPAEVGLVRLALLRARDLRDSDVVVATSWDTAEDLARVLPDSTAGAYLIQSHETWAGPTARVDATWRLPLTRMAVARWLVDLGARLGAAPVHHVPNAVDADLFRLRTPPAERDPDGVLMLWHPDHVKGSDVGLAALELLRARRPSLRAQLFGVPPRPAHLPAWVDYRQRPGREELSALYDAAAVFLAPSRLEGWALPPAEAMACGAAVVATDIGGHRDYAEDGRTAVLVPPEDPVALATAAAELLADRDRRVALALAGSARMREDFSWARSTGELLTALEGAVAARAVLPSGRGPRRRARR